MATCAHCGRELRPEWKFCVTCGTPTGIVATLEIAAAPEPAPEPAPNLTPEPAPALLTAPVAIAAASAPSPAPTHIPTLEVTAPPRSTAEPTSIRTRSRERVRAARTSPVAIVAFVLGCLLSPLAAVVGHIALAQLHTTRERGRALAIAAIALGYGALAIVLVAVLAYVVGHA